MPHRILIKFSLLSVSEGYIMLYPGSVEDPNFPKANLSYSVSALSTIAFDNTVSNYVIEGNYPL